MSYRNLFNLQSRTQTRLHGTHAQKCRRTNQAVLGAAACMLALTGFQQATAQFDLYEPFVAVDLEPMLQTALGIELQLQVVDGAVTDVNDAGYAVGWYQLDGADFPQPFFFSPVDGGEMTLLPFGDQRYPGDDYQGAKALGLTNLNGSISSGAWRDVILVGAIYEDDSTTALETEAVAWHYDTNTESWQVRRLFDDEHPGGPSRTQSTANAVNEAGYTTGSIVVDQNTNAHQAFIADVNNFPIALDHFEIYDLVIGNSQEPSVEAWGINQHNEAVGFQFDMANSNPIEHQPIHYYNGATNIMPGVGDQPGDPPIGLALDINDAGHAVGSAGSQLSNAQPNVWWWSTSLDDWLRLELTGLPAAYLAAEATDINNQNEIVGHATNGTEGAFYALLTDNAPAADNSAIDLTDLVLFPSSVRGSASITTANAVNENGWIAGAYQPDSATSIYHPILFIPNDVDNDGIPDIREIINGTEPDQNENWLIDWAENDPNASQVNNLRLGLHAPGFDGAETKAELIQNNQIVRLTGLVLERIKQSVDPEYGEEGGLSIADLSYQENCEANREECMDLLEDVQGWNNSGSAQREIIFTIRNPDKEPGRESNDSFEPLGSEKRQEWVNAIRTFSYRWAHTVDYAQFGNETYSGAGQIYFDVSSDLSSGYVGNFSNLRKKNQLIDGTAAVLDWIQEQVEAARIGSALAGRPWRFIGPGHPMGVITLGWQGNPDVVLDTTSVPWVNRKHAAAYVIRETGRMLNDNRMYFDLHLHYKTVAKAQMAVDQLTSQSAPWAPDNPQSLGILEFGPKGDTSAQNVWWQDNQAEFPRYFTEGAPHPQKNWDDFIKDPDINDKGWEAGQYGSVGDFSMTNLLNQIGQKPFALVCYGPTNQGAQAPDVFAIAALRASQLAEASYTLDPDYFSPIRGNYESAASTYQLPALNFTPHQAAADPEIVCPPCDSP